MAEYVVACKAEELPPGKSIVIVHEKWPIAVFNVDGAYFAVSNVCPHAAGPLEYGFIEHGRIVCPWHGWSFSLSPDDPPNDGLPRYRVSVVDGEVRLLLPEIEPQKGWR